MTTFFKVFLQRHLLYELNFTKPSRNWTESRNESGWDQSCFNFARILFSAERVCKLILSEWHSSSRNCDSFLSRVYNLKIDLAVQKTLHPNFLMLWSDIKEFPSRNMSYFVKWQMNLDLLLLAVKLSAQVRGPRNVSRE